MKNLKLFPKLFIYTFSSLAFSILVIHLLVYLIFPNTYLRAKKEDLTVKADQISQSLNGKSLDYVKQALDFFSKDGDINASVKENNDENSLKLEQNIDFDINSNTNSLIIEEREITLNNGKTVNLQFLSTSNIRQNAKILSLKFLPITLSISFLFSGVVSLIFAKFVTNNINQIKYVTSKMMKLDKSAFLKVDSTNEAGQLKSQINNLYQTLLKLMNDMEIKNNEILNLEKLKYEVFRGASHELKTPLASLKIILENMSYNIGKYKDKEKYIKECLVIVDELTQRVYQILTTSSFDYLKDDEETVNINDSLKNILINYDILMKQKNISLNNNLKNETIFIGRTALKIVLSNLISNAVKYTDENGFIDIFVKDGFLHVENSYKNISTLDIEKMSKIKIYSKKDTSNGLGLYIIKNILSNYKIFYKIEKTKTSIAFLIELN